MAEISPDILAGKGFQRQVIETPRGPVDVVVINSPGFPARDLASIAAKVMRHPPGPPSPERQ